MRELAALRPDQQRANELGVPGELRIDARLDAIFRIGAAVEVLREQRLAFGVSNEVVEQKLEFLGRQPAVLFPPDGLFRLRVDHDELVLGAAPGVHAGLGAERAAIDERALVVGDGMLDKRGIGQIPVDRGQVFQAEFFRTMGAVPETRFLHPRLR